MSHPRLASEAAHDLHAPPGAPRRTLWGPPEGPPNAENLAWQRSQIRYVMVGTVLRLRCGWVVLAMIWQYPNVSSALDCV